MSVAEAFWDLLGNWAGVEEQAASPWAPAARTRAALTFRQDLGGTAVVQDYRQVRVDAGESRERPRAEVSGRPGEPSSPTTEFLAHGVFLADEAAPEMVLWWLFDSAGHAPDPARGQWSGRTLELVRTTPRGAATHRFELEADRLAYAIDLTLTGQETVPFLRGRYQRVSGH